MTIQVFNDVNSDLRIFLLSTRCHRTGLTKHVHVYKLATAQSVECRIFKIAFSKLKLEHVVIGKGQFQQGEDKHKSFEAKRKHFEEKGLKALKMGTLKD
uniref:Helicase C-terminal domain-containing protein n=1 Tax=Lactuca sativa TaxID=4236 RepID=A0A9R1W223_LACSA|nr:hypothetical protein LSAT_V11C300108580 [Lactuca sativa]